MSTKIHAACALSSARQIPLCRPFLSGPKPPRHERQPVCSVEAGDFGADRRNRQKRRWLQCGWLVKLRRDFLEVFALFTAVTKLFVRFRCFTRFNRDQLYWQVVKHFSAAHLRPPVPMLMSVGDLIADMQREDPGVTASVFSQDGQRVANTTLIDTLLDKDFQLIVNDKVYDVKSPEKACVSSEHAVGLEDVKNIVHLLHTAIHQPEHHLLKERQLLEKMDNLKQQLSPLEKMKAQLSHTAEFHSSKALWVGLALLSVQGGALAWLTWWVYSWDVMEPVTYFITYATSMGAFSYYVLTKQDAKDRQFLQYFHKAATKKNFNVAKYNELKDELAQVEEDLKRLRNPLRLQLPLDQIQLKPSHE
ncbi:hypothetical protein fugu_008136 [Takifugu bimaculatus]|uniref:Calcium uniporter protein n=1 Tax=Takifugu bimaculatus TaxID=433685 RepID=A0A4Z2B1L6_9TELE|nr:hypothetical protein fugu_008136 [Takifugu bimaculatus]